ncbi:MAG: rod-binding protein [Planctomycetes bacterium]|nr:rod-binding protein [Planctomycetota bacterium]
MDGISLPGIEVSAGQNLSKAQLERAQRLGESENVTKAAVEFEKLMATMLVKEMRSSLKDGFFPSGPGNDTYNAWFDEKIGESLARSNALGLAGQLKTAMGAQPTETVPGAGPQGGSDD